MLNEKQKQLLRELNKILHAQSSRHRTSAPISGSDRAKEIFLLRNEIEILKGNIEEISKDYTEEYGKLKNYIEKVTDIFDKTLEKLVVYSTIIEKVKNGEYTIDEVFGIDKENPDGTVTNTKYTEEYITDTTEGASNYLNDVVYPMFDKEVLYPSLNTLSNMINLVFYNTIQANTVLKSLVQTRKYRESRIRYYEEYEKSENISQNFNIYDVENINLFGSAKLPNPGDSKAYRLFSINPQYDSLKNSITKGNNIIDFVLAKNGKVLYVQNTGRTFNFNRSFWANDPRFLKIIKTDKSSFSGSNNRGKNNTLTTPNKDVNLGLIFEQSEYQKEKISLGKIDSVLSSENNKIYPILNIKDNIEGINRCCNYYNKYVINRINDVKFLENNSNNERPYANRIIDKVNPIFFRNSKNTIDKTVKYEEESVLPKIVPFGDENTIYMVPVQSDNNIPNYNVFGFGKNENNIYGCKSDYDDTNKTGFYVDKIFSFDKQKPIINETVIDKIDICEYNVGNLVGGYMENMYICVDKEGYLIVNNYVLDGNEFKESEKYDIPLRTNYNNSFLKLDIPGLNGKVKKIYKGLTDNTHNYSGDYISDSLYVIDTDNNLWVHGNNGYNRFGLGEGTDDSFKYPDFVTGFIKIDAEFNGKIKKIATNVYNTIVLTTDGNIYISGLKTYSGLYETNESGNLRTWTKHISFVNKILDIESSVRMLYLITKENDLYICGNGTNYQFGDGTRTPKFYFTKQSSCGKVKKVYPAIFKTLLIDINDNLWGCGESSYNELTSNDSQTTMRKYTTSVDLTTGNSSGSVENGLLDNVYKVVEICDGREIFLISKDKNLYHIGVKDHESSRNQTSDLYSNAVLFDKVVLFNKNVEDIYAISNSIIVKTSNNEFYITFNKNRNSSKSKYLNNAVYSHIFNFSKIDGLNIKQISISRRVIQILTEENELYTNLSQNIEFFKYSTQTSSSENMFMSGLGTFLKLTRNGKLRVCTNYCTQKNECGLSYIQNIFVKEYNSGLLYGMGYNTKGALGVGDTNNHLGKFIPLKFEQEEVRDVVCSSKDNTYLIDNESNLWVSGDNSDGQLGLGDNSDRNTFTKVETFDKNVSCVITAGITTYLIDYDNNLWVCGNNSNGQFGDGTQTSSNVFKKIDTFKVKFANILLVNLNYDSPDPNTQADFKVSGFVVDEENNLWVTGYNGFGQLGDNTFDDVLTWKKITISDEKFDKYIKKIEFGERGTVYFINYDGDLYGCGYNLKWNIDVSKTNIKKPQKIQFVSSYENVKEVIKSVYNEGDNAASASYPYTAGPMFLTSNRNLYMLLETGEDTNQYGFINLNAEFENSYNKNGKGSVIKCVQVKSLAGILCLMFEKVGNIKTELYYLGFNILGESGNPNFSGALEKVDLTDIIGADNYIIDIYSSCNTFFILDKNNKLYTVGNNLYKIDQTQETTSNIKKYTLLPPVDIDKANRLVCLAWNLNDIVVNENKNTLLFNSNNQFLLSGQYIENGYYNEEELNTSYGVKSIERTDLSLDNYPMIKTNGINKGVIFYKIEDEDLNKTRYCVSGSNESGASGIPTITNSGKLDFVEISYPLADNTCIADIQTNGVSTLLLTKSGDLYAAGSNPNGVLGNIGDNVVNGWTKTNTDFKVSKILYFDGESNTFIATTDDKIYCCGKNAYGSLGVNNNGDPVKSFTLLSQFKASDINGIFMNPETKQNMTIILLNNGDLYYACRSYTGKGGKYNLLKSGVFLKTDIYGSNVRNSRIYDDYLMVLPNGVAYIDNTNTFRVLELLHSIGSITENYIENAKNFSILRKDDYCIDDPYATLFGSGNTNTISVVTLDGKLYYRGYHEYNNLFGVSGSSRINDFTRLDNLNPHLTDNILLSKCVRKNQLVVYTMDNYFYACGGPKNSCYSLGITPNYDSDEIITDFTKVNFSLINDISTEMPVNYNVLGIDYNINKPFNTSNTYLTLFDNKYKIVPFGGGVSKKEYQVEEVSDGNLFKELYYFYLYADVGFFAVDTNNNLWMCGKLTEEYQTGTPNLSIYTKVMSGIKKLIINSNSDSEFVHMYDKLFVIKDDTTISVHGTNTYGSLGTNNTTSVTKGFTDVSLSSLLTEGDSIKDIKYNEYITFVITEKGNVYWAGTNTNGVISTTTTEKSYVFKKLNTSILIDSIYTCNKFTVFIAKDKIKYYSGYYGDTVNGYVFMRKIFSDESTSNIYNLNKIFINMVIESNKYNSLSLSVTDISGNNRIFYLGDGQIFDCGLTEYDKFKFIEIERFKNNFIELYSITGTTYVIDNNNTLYISGLTPNSYSTSFNKEWTNLFNYKVEKIFESSKSNYEDKLKFKVLTFKDTYSSATLTFYKRLESEQLNSVLIYNSNVIDVIPASVKSDNKNYISYIYSDGNIFIGLTDDNKIYYTNFNNYYGAIGDGSKPSSISDGVTSAKKIFDLTSIDINEKIIFGFPILSSMYGTLLVTEKGKIYLSSASLNSSKQIGFESSSDFTGRFEELNYLNDVTINVTKKDYTY